MAQLHSTRTANHRPYADVYADAAERLAATGFVRAFGGGVVPFDSNDLYKKVLQLDNATEWVLTAITPTWVQVGGDGLVPAAHAAEHENGGSDEIDVTGLSGVLADPQIAGAVVESAGPTLLVVGAVADGEFLKRSGSTVVSGVPAGTGAETGANSDITSMDGLTGALQYTTRVDFTEGAAPSTPAASKVSLYAKADGLLYSKDDAGTETLVSGGAGGGGSVDILTVWALT